MIKGDHQHAEHVDAANHGGVKRHSAQTCVGQGCTAINDGQSGAAPGAGGGIAQQRKRNRGDRVKSQSHKERRGDGGGGAGAGGTLKKDGEHHADDDYLYAAVIADKGDGTLDLFDSAGITQNVQNHERTEHHQYDLETLFDAFPDQCVIDGHIFLEGGAGHIEIVKASRSVHSSAMGATRLAD